MGRNRVVGLVSIALLGLALGDLRGTQLAQRLTGYDDLMNRQVYLQLQANEDAVYGKGGQLTFAGNHIRNAITGERLPGQIGVSGLGMNAVYGGDEILVYGKLREGLGSYQGFMSYADLTLVAAHPSPLSELRRKFSASVLSVLPEPEASFGMGLLIGQRATLPEDVKADLQKVGLTHIIAVSGANLTIMLEASRRVLGHRSKRLSTGLSLGLMVAFVLMTGGSASIIRAAYVSLLSVVAAYYGRRFKPLLIITGAAAITAYIDPLYIWGDASWYLSFLAFFGVLVVSPLLERRLSPVFRANILLAIALESFCAEIMSVPYILYTFGQISFMGLLANVLVTSVIPYAMLFGLIAGLAGMLWWPVAGWFAWPAQVLLTYMLDMAQWLAGRPHIFVDNVWLSASGALVCYASIAILIALLGFKDRRKSAIITDDETFEPYKLLGRMT
jgi:competence protein ComEC